MIYHNIVGSATMYIILHYSVLITIQCHPVPRLNENNADAVTVCIHNNFATIALALAVAVTIVIAILML